MPGGAGVSGMGVGGMGVGPALAGGFGGVDETAFNGDLGMGGAGGSMGGVSLSKCKFKKIVSSCKILNRKILVCKKFKVWSLNMYAENMVINGCLIKGIFFPITKLLIALFLSTFQPIKILQELVIRGRKKELHAKHSRV